MIHGDSFEILRGMPDDSVDVCITDPPYSERQHRGVRSSGRNRGLGDGNGRISPCDTRRVVDLGFQHFTRTDCLRICHELARVVRRWSIVFCDDDLLPVWRSAARKAGLEPVRVLHWIRIGGAPQFTGDRPASGVEYMVLMHRPGRKRWNGGGKAGVYSYPIVANRSGHRQDRVHTTQKNEEHIMELVADFSDPDEIIGDWFAGSGTTGVAALRLGRRFIGIEKDPKYAAIARERLQAEERGQSLQHYRAGQVPLFGGGR